MSTTYKPRTRVRGGDSRNGKQDRKCTRRSSSENVFTEVLVGVDGEPRVPRVRSMSSWDERYPFTTFTPSFLSSQSLTFLGSCSRSWFKVVHLFDFPKSGPHFGSSTIFTNILLKKLYLYFTSLTIAVGRGRVWRGDSDRSDFGGTTSSTSSSRSGPRGRREGVEVP